MPTLTIKGIPEDLYERLKQSATAHRRSLNSEVLVLLESALQRPRRDPAVILARADALRERLERLNVPPVTEEFLRAAKDEGRL